LQYPNGNVETFSVFRFTDVTATQAEVLTRACPFGFACRRHQPKRQQKEVTVAGDCDGQVLGGNV
jgi:hypothetical protein